MSHQPPGSRSEQQQQMQSAECKYRIAVLIDVSACARASSCCALCANRCRQPLQTYLQTPVRPAAVVAPPVAAPVAIVAPIAAPAPSPAAVAAAAQLFPPPSGPGLFGAPTTPPAAFAAAVPAAEHLSSLLQTSPHGTPRQSISTNVFAESTTPPSAAAAAAAAAPFAASSSPSAQQQRNVAPANSSFSFSPSSASSGALQSSSSFTSPAQGAPGSLSSVSSPSAAAPLRLEQTFDHPLLGGGGGGPSPSPSPTSAAAAAATQQQGGMVLPGPLGPLGPPRMPSGPRPSRAGSVGQNSSAAGGQAQAQDNIYATAPPGSARSGSVQSIPSPLSSTPQPPLPPIPAAAAAPQPQASPDEKLSTLMEILFEGTPPPGKLAAFDVSAVSKDLAGLEKLAEKGCWREVMRLAENLLELPPATSIATMAGKSDSTAPPSTTPASTAVAAAVVPIPIPTALMPHSFYQIVHMYLSALVKLRKTDMALQVAQRIGPPFGADKLYSSHTVYTGTTAGQQQTQFVGNMLPFELHLLLAELPHFNPAGARTRHALDQLMKVLQWMKAMQTRKKNEIDAQQPQQDQQPAEGTATNATKEKRNSVNENGSLSGSGTGTLSSSTTLSSSNPFSLTSPHTQTSLTPAQLSSQLLVIRLHVANLCVSFGSSLDLDYSSARSWLREISRDAPSDPRVPEALARVNLAVGDLRRAEKYVAKARSIYESRGEGDHVNIGLHQVLLSLARNDYAQAFKLSSSLLAAHPTRVDVANNFAVVALYVPEGMAKGIQALEGLLRADPLANTQESVVSNLRALYDLSSANPSLKRRMLEGLVMMYGEDSLELSS